MLKLYGFSVSNYYNMVKLALLEKGLPFEEVPFYAGQTPEALAVSPRGKVPVLGVKQGFINETSVILEYLEQSQEGPALLPADPFARAQVLALCREIELYIELPARACYAEAFFGMTVPEAIKEKSRAELLLGMGTLGRHGKFAPYVAGESFTLADLYFMYSLSLACGVGEKLFGLDLLEQLPKAKALLARLNEMPNAQKVEADRQAAMPAFMAMIAAKK
ncbi:MULTISPECIES: glutathione S-transferase [Pseudomonas]|jgi:glutathione S-transferase|uniref:Glutathione S-transferase n=3 Tax=Pseudomonas TaxID=286 RepID=A0A109L4J8_PSEFL|nr:MULTISPECIES: glutathione S-transferase [Pseudomonas]KRP97544.1 glutathione S-transferase [Pseudomonas lactis]KWV80913.1 Glutathione S-transferase [Pseudomonas fluorescens]KWV88474.1 Glutathione S-transferase [Pseudomonas fluorescens]MBA1252212.1 glutathione S-transferase family protein [Pseudomonas carnis]MBA1266665.1 glutathione S-transferase family protein [Pseudomonas carnis]|tara:strand:- start:54 stop:713 length:660 start_codon:yes stop_codon:yes gene_type:complete